MTTIVFFNNKSGTGKTSLAYHLAWMFADRGIKVVAADLDPQANLTSMFLELDRLEDLWPEGDHPQSILGAIKPLVQGTGEIASPHVEDVADNIGLIVGDLGFSSFEERFAEAWKRCLDGDESAFRLLLAFHRVLLKAIQEREADVALVDVGPNLGAINRAVMISGQFVVLPLLPDVYSWQSLRSLGPALHRWREEWNERAEKNPLKVDLPAESMRIAGYVFQQHAMRLDRPVLSYQHWMRRIPAEYRESVLRQSPENAPAVKDDPECLHLLKPYRNLMLIAAEARKPMFFLKPADGALGSIAAAVQDCYRDYKALALALAKRCGLAVS